MTLSLGPKSLFSIKIKYISYGIFPNLSHSPPPLISHLFKIENILLNKLNLTYYCKL